METKKGDRYETKHDEDDLENLAERLTADLRGHIHQLADPKVLSEAWCQMADLMGRISFISEQEASLPKEKKNATLWECEEIALRYILEDGKLNLCLRNLVAFREYESNEMSKPSGRPTPPEHLEKMDKFEKGLGIVLRNAWRHIEALRTTDLPLLIDHIDNVLITGSMEYNPKIERCMKSGDMAERQEVVVLYYLDGMAGHGDALDESSYMPILRERKLIVKLARFLATKMCPMVDFAPSLKGGFIVGMQALSKLVDTEDFTTYMSAHIESDADASMFVGLKRALSELLEDDDLRPSLRPLKMTIQDLEDQFDCDDDGHK